MVQDIQALIERYLCWLREKTTLRELGDGVEITTPYLDRHNDYLQIYAFRAKNGDIVLTDDGYIVDDLEMSGCNLDGTTRQSTLQMTLNGFGVAMNGRALEIQTSIEDFASRKHNLVQAMLAVNDLFYMTSPIVKSFFLEDVTRWLDSSHIRYSPRCKFTGKSGYDHLFDFVIPKSRQCPERMLKLINRPDRNSAQSLVFSWIDTKDIRAKESRAYACLNDSEHEVSEAALGAFRSYGVNPIIWSRREKVQEELAA